MAASLWALIGVFTTGILSAGVGAMEIAFWRAVIAGGIFVGHAFLLGELKLYERRDGWTFFGFGLVGVSLFFGAYNLAIETGGISLAVILLYTAPVFVIISARLFLQEAITGLKVVAVLLVVAGVSLVMTGGGGSGVSVTPQSVIWGLVAGLGYGSFYIVGKFLLLRYHPVTIYAFVLPAGALGLLPFVDFAPRSLEVWGLLLALSVLSTYLAYLVYFLGLQRADASRAVLVASLEPVIAASLAAIFFDERLGALGILGAALVVLASAIGAFAPSEEGAAKDPA